LVAAVISQAATSDKAFQAGAANDYAHQSSGRVTVGAKPFDSEQLTAEAFGKADLLKYGVLPVLVVIENKRPTAIDLEDIEVRLVAADGRHAEPVPPQDIPFLASHAKRPAVVKPYPPIPLPKKKNPLNTPEIVMRAFAAKVVPPGDSASGFFYFEARPEAGDKLYLNGLRDARTQEEIIYLEFPLNQ
jgi:hypothetical protein